MKWINNFKLSVKIALLAVIGVLVAIIALVGLAYWLSNDYNKLAKKEIDILAVSDLDHIAMGVYNMVKIQDALVRQQVDNNLKVADHVLYGKGGISFVNENTVWRAVNQFTQEAVTIQLPQVFIEGKWIGQNTAPETSSPVVDEITDMVGGTATIFQRMNDEGDMLRVATNVMTSSGQRAIGTYIPAVNSDGSQNAVISTILKNQIYRGRAFVVDAWYITAYQPLYDVDGAIIGMLYVGVKQENIAALRSAIINTQVGKTGYVYVLGGQGTQKGQYIISRNSERDGENILNSQDADGRFFIKSIIEKALVLKEGEITSETYAWKNSGEPAARLKIVRIVYYEPWDWIIGVGVYQDELEQYQSIIEDGRSKMVNLMVLAGLIVSLAVAFVSILAARSIVAPINHLASMADEIASGNVDLEISYDRHDEVGTLANSFRGMISYLREMVVGMNQLAQGDLTVNLVPRSSKDALGDALVRMLVSLRNVISQVAQSANSVNEAAAQLAVASERSGDAVIQIATAVKQVAQGIGQQTQGVTKTSEAVEHMSRVIEGVASGAQEQAAAIGKASQVAVRITSAIEQVTNNARMVTRDASQAADYSRAGARTVNEMIGGMNTIRGKVGLSATKVAEMGSRSEEIGAIVETIEDIASQTNLLALNAAIEAARAGEQGKGFAVVADEVRKLAERSSLATKEIAGLIKGIQSTVREAVKTMNESASEVEAGVHRAGSAGRVLEDILSAAESVDKQSESAGLAAAKVSEAAIELVEAVNAVSIVIEENTEATEKMAVNSNELTQVIENIASVSEENSASVEEVSFSMKKVSDQVAGVSASASALMGMAKGLQQIVSRFKLDIPG